MKRTLFLTLIALLAVSMASAAGDASAGKAQYDKACKGCHGAAGRHNPSIAKAMKVDMKDLGSGEVQSMSDDDLRKAVTNGVGKMRPIKSVSGVEVDNIIAYMRTFK